MCSDRHRTRNTEHRVYRKTRTAHELFPLQGVPLVQPTSQIKSVLWRVSEPLSLADLDAVVEFIPALDQPHANPHIDLVNLGGRSSLHNVIEMLIPQLA